MIDQYILITDFDDEESIRLAKRCKRSFEKQYISNIIEFPLFKYDDENVYSPETEEYKNRYEFVRKTIKVKNNNLTTKEISKFLSHIFVWIESIYSDKYIGVLEESAVLKKIPKTFPSKEQFVNLDYSENGLMKDDSVSYMYFANTHAYALTPSIARMLIANVLVDGIECELNKFLRRDKYQILFDPCIVKGYNKLQK